MKKLLLATVATAALAGAASAEDAKIGISLGYTGPLESMSPAMTPPSGSHSSMTSSSSQSMGGDASNWIAKPRVWPRSSCHGTVRSRC